MRGITAKTQPYRSSSSAPHNASEITKILHGYKRLALCPATRCDQLRALIGHISSHAILANVSPHTSKTELSRRWHIYDASISRIYTTVCLTFPKPYSRGTQSPITTAFSNRWTSGGYPVQTLCTTYFICTSGIAPR